MSAATRTAAPRPAAPAPGPAPGAAPPRAGRRRWLRLVLPLLPAVAVTAVVLGAHAAEQADPADPAYLSPVSRAATGAATAAGRVTGRGGTVERYVTSAAALAAARTGGAATVVVAAPQFTAPGALRELTRLPAGSRLVLVTPDQDALDGAGLPAAAAGPRWTAAVTAAGCDPGRGPAAARRWHYTVPGGAVRDCHGGGQVELDVRGTPVTLVGAADPLRNDRIGEHANAAFADDVLGRTRRVVWLDLHAPEPPPPGPPAPTGTATGPSPRPGGSGDGPPVEGPDGPPPPPDDPGDDAPPPPDGGGLADSPLARAFPPAVWAAVLLVVLAVVALAAASARRLGAPVPEPLPVRVPAAETVRGHAGLYRRARARDASLATLQAAAVRRLAAHFGTRGGFEEVAARTAAATGLPVHEVRAVLGGGVEDTDADLARAAAAVQHLVHHVTGRPEKYHDDEENRT